MGTAFRRIDPGVADQLLAAPHRFEFFQAVRVLLAQHRARKAEAANAPHAYAGNALRFRSHLSLAFPASEIHDLRPMPPKDKEPSETAPQWEMSVNFMGLVGPSGVLPQHYTERLLERKLYHRDTAAHAFMDLFSHRMTALFYEAWRKYRLPLEYEALPSYRRRPRVASFFGLGLPAVQDQFDADGSDISVETLCFYSGLYTQRTRPSSNLVQILEHYFGVRFELEQFVGRWIELKEEQCTRLGSANSALDSSLVAGTRIWDRQTMARLRIGPLTRDQFQKFLPGSPNAAALKKLLRFSTGVSLDYEIRLVLRREDVLPSRMEGDAAPRLGFDGWVQTHAAEKNADDTVYMIAA